MSYVTGLEVEYNCTDGKTISYSVFGIEIEIGQDLAILEGWNLLK